MWCQPYAQAQPDESLKKYSRITKYFVHVWDYRRYVAEKSATPPQSELDYCTEKIEKNFSNYSSWHYRSKLLPRLHPHESDPNRPISERVLKDELSMVLKATFTAPNDSSAWFYQRWLLGYSAPALDLAAFKITPTQAIVSFSIPVNLNDPLCSLSLDSRTKFDTSKFQPVGSSTNFSCIWMLKDSFEFNDNAASDDNATRDDDNAAGDDNATGDNTRFILEFVDESGTKHTLTVNKIGPLLFGIKLPKFEYEFEASVRDELKQQLIEFDELSTIEEDSKWTLLTRALMMRAIDRSRYHSTALSHLRTLCDLDTMRAGYYEELMSKWNIEEELSRWINSPSSGTTIDLSSVIVKTLHYDQYMCVAERISLGENSIKPKIQRKIDDIYAVCGVDVSS